MFLLKSLNGFVLLRPASDLSVITSRKGLTPEIDEVPLVHEYLKEMNAHEVLRDEAYCQLIKQTTGNKNKESNLLGWRMLYIASLTLKPSRVMTRIVKQHICQYAKPVGLCGYNDVEDLASLTLKFLDRDIRMRSRPVDITGIFSDENEKQNEVPITKSAPEPQANKTNEENKEENETSVDSPPKRAKSMNRLNEPWHYPYDEFLKMQSLSASVEIEKLFAESAQNVVIDVYTMDPERPPITIALDPLGNDDQHLVAKRICKLMDVFEYTRYGLFLEVQLETIKDEKEIKLFSKFERHANRWIEQSTPIQLVESTIQNNLIQSQINGKYSSLVYKYKWYKWCYSPLDKEMKLETDVYADLLYLQARNDVQDGKKFQLSHEKCAMVITIEWMKSKRGRTMYPEEIPHILKTIPKWIRNTTPDQQWKLLVLESTHKIIEWQKHRYVKAKSNHQAQSLSSMDFNRLYLGVVQSNHMYGTSYFPVRIIEPERWSKYEQLLFGCNWKYLLICDKSYMVLRSIQMEKVKSLRQSSKVITEVEIEHRDSYMRTVSIKFVSLNFKAPFIATQVFDLKMKRKE